MTAKPDIFERLNPSSPSTALGELAPADDTRLVMCRPAYLSTAIANNVFMKSEPIDVPRALRQFTHITRLLREMGVTVLEIPPTPGAQDQTYTANVALAIRESRQIVLAHYKAEGRPIEEAPAREFFEGMGYRVIRPPTFFEGEADCKRWKPGVFFGGHGKFTDRATLDWISDQCGVQMVPLRETSDELYHLDCSLAVLDPEHFLVNRAGFDAASFKTLETLGEVIEVPTDIMACGATNIVKVPGKRILLSGMFFPEEAKYRQAMEWMYALCDRLGYSVIFVDIDQADKSGADVSCQVMNLDFPPR